MTTMPFRPAVRLVAAALGVTTTTAITPAQTACGHWEPLVGGLIGDIGSSATRVSDLAVFDAGDGPMLYMAGNFEVVVDPVFGEVRAPGLARFDGVRWSAVPGLDGLGLELDRRAIALEVFDDGSGPALYVGGEFRTASGREALGIARWDGVEWSGLDGPGEPGGISKIVDIHPHDFGEGPMLYAAGVIFMGAGTPPEFIRRWNGTAWSSPGDERPSDGEVFELASFGGDLYAAGQYDRIGARPASGIARFDGTAWTTPLGPDQRLTTTRFWPLLPTEVDGRDVLAAGGIFAIDEGVERIALHLAAWDGQRWDSLVRELPTTVFNPTALAAFDDGSGPALFIGGQEVAEGTSIARVRDGVLTPLPPPGMGTVLELFVHDGVAGPALLAGGEFQDGLGAASFLARWVPDAPCRADLDADCRPTIFDFLAFGNLFAAGDPAADFDGDGELTILDFLAFQTAFAAGCQ